MVSDTSYFLEWARLRDENYAALMRHANALLPDGHPLKITRDDVTNVLAFANYLREYSSFGIAEMFQQDDYRTLAAKLAALLPPKD